MVPSTSKKKRRLSFLLVTISSFLISSCKSLNLGKPENFQIISSKNNFPENLPNQSVQIKPSQDELVEFMKYLLGPDDSSSSLLKHIDKFGNEKFKRSSKWSSEGDFGYPNINSVDYNKFSPSAFGSGWIFSKK